MAAIGMAWWLGLLVGCASGVLLFRRGAVPGALVQIREESQVRFEYAKSNQ